MRILLDYRPALRRRTGVGEFVHQLARELARGPDELTLFTASWKDRPDPAAVADLSPARFVDRRLPVRWLNRAWLRAGWPPVELLCGRRFDLVHSPSPAAVPTRGAATVITVHDLDFLSHPERAWGEMRDVWPTTARASAERADAIIVPSRYTSARVTELLQVDPDRIFVCPHGLPPGWTDGVATTRGASPSGGRRHILFVGTLSARKNIAGLLDAYERLTVHLPAAPPLVLAGEARPEAAPWLDRLGRAPLAGRARHLGYVTDDQRRQLYLESAMLVLPSFDEGFGLPVLEAMALGVPVVVSNRGALGEVAGDAGLLVDPSDHHQLAAAMASLLADSHLAARLGEAGRRRALAHSWSESARLVRRAYAVAFDRRASRARAQRR